MLTIRCTRILLKRFDAEVHPEPEPPTNRLGDWHAKLLFTRRARLIICVSERSLLSVFVEARDPAVDVAGVAGSDVPLNPAWLSLTGTSLKISYRQARWSNDEAQGRQSKQLYPAGTTTGVAGEGKE